MSPSEQQPSFPLSIRVFPPVGAEESEIRLLVYDGWDKLYHSGQGGAQLQLPAGLYTVRWEYASDWGEQVVRLPHTQEVNLEVKRSTPAPSPGSSDTHEYYSFMNQTVEATDSTGEPLTVAGAPLSSRLHLLLRAHRREAYRGEDMANGLRLLDAALQPLFDLRQRSRLDMDAGYLLCSLPAAAGRYYLEYTLSDPGGRPRLFPLDLLADWQTRLFLFFAGGQPDFTSASLTLLRLSYRDEYEYDKRCRTDAAADAALAALQRNQLLLPKEIERGLLSGKFENPLLGLLGAHFLMRHPDASKTQPEQEARWRSMAEQVFYNLESLLPGSPDVLALRYKAARRYPGDARFPIPTAPLGQPPLLRASLEALLEADSESVVALEDGSLLERLAPNLYFDSPWATFHPLAIEQTSDATFVEGAYNMPATPEIEDWLRDSVQEVLQAKRRRGGEPDWVNLATGLGVSVRKIKQAVEQVKKLTSGKEVELY